ncbi:MAG: hypothetical protein AAFQ68_03320 [Bacteroidota bacterium]
MNVAPSFDLSLLGAKPSKVAPDYWDQVLKLYEEQSYKEAILGILQYVDEGLITRTGNAEQTRFEIPHGSAVVYVEIGAEALHVEAPFLRIDQANKIPLLRQVAQINFTPLNLAKIILKDEKLAFHYTCPLALCEPYKMYEVFREICFYADHYDDEFIQKFGAQWIQEPVIHPFREAEKKKAWERVQAYVEEAFAYIEYFENKRSFAHAWDIVALTLWKIEYYCEPQGIFRNELQKAIENQQENASLIDKVNRGKDYLRKLQQSDQQAFEADLYRTERFIPIKFRSTPENIRTNFEEAYQRAKAERDGNDHLGATLTLSSIFLKLFYYNHVEESIANPIEKALQEASGRSWAEASDLLWNAMNNFMRPQSQENSRPKRRLWSFLGFD